MPLAVLKTALVSVASTRSEANAIGAAHQQVRLPWTTVTEVSTRAFDDVAEAEADRHLDLISIGAEAMR